MAKPGGFWSYAHKDDEADFGRITNLGRDVVAQYEMLTGESIDLFLDRDSLEWGDAWRAKVDGSLATVAFFIPVVTPRYFQSTECRRELRFFATNAQRLGLSELVMPLLYVDFPGLHEQDPADELIKIVNEFQWQPWTDLRFTERSSAEYLKNVNALATRLAAANATAAAVSLTMKIEEPIGDEDDPPGMLDRIAEAELALPKWSDTIVRVGQIIESLGEDMSNATQEMSDADKRGQGFVGRLTVSRKLAQAIDGPGEEVLELSSQFVEQLSTVDSGIRQLIELGASVDDASEPAERESLLEFFENVEELAGSAREGFATVADFLESMEPIERMSRDLRAPLRKFRQGLTVMSEAQVLMDEWVQLIQVSPINQAQ